MEEELDKSIRESLLELAEHSLKKGDFEDTKLFSGVAKQYGERLKQPYQPRDKYQRIIPAP